MESQMLHIRVGVGIYQWIKAQAKTNNRSLTGEVNNILKKESKRGDVK